MRRRSRFAQLLAEITEAGRPPPPELLEATLHPPESLPVIIDRARQKLEEARTLAEVWEAKQGAELALHFAKILGATAAVHADCILLMIECRRRVGNELIDAMKRGEIAGRGRRWNSNSATHAELGLSPRQAAECQDIARTPPKVIARAIEDAVLAKKVPTQAIARDAIRKYLKKPKKQVPSDVKQWIILSVRIDATKLRAFRDSLDDDDREACIERMQAIRNTLDEVLSVPDLIEPAESDEYRRFDPGTDLCDQDFRPAG